MEFGFLQGLFTRDQNSNLFMSGELWKERRHAFLQKFLEKLEFAEMGFHFLTCIWVLGRGH